jgi:two-component system CheB/CheR fusion protein
VDPSVGNPSFGKKSKQTAGPADGPGADRPRPGASGPVFVGIGASAGALGVLERLFSLLPASSGMVFVVVQHLERHHPSVLAEILGKHTQMPVRPANDQARAQPNHVYIIPPNAVLTLEHGLLRVARSDETGLRTPIDAFFRSLGRDQGEHAIGVILSGAGSDGTVGLRVVKEHGGLTLAQSPETARYDSMPRSAIAAGVVDLALSVEEMPDRILAHARRITDVQREAGKDFDDQLTAQLGAISEILKRQTGHDFTDYKPGTLLRRIRRRIQLQQMAAASDYVRYLEHEPAEVEQLHRDLLIGVTYFFRDPEVFASLATEVIPRILESDPRAQTRIWVPGCASGEEAYSLAILAQEHLARIDAASALQIFATDIDGDLLAKARIGHYPASIDQHVSAERLERFFVREGDGYQVVKEVRSICTFSEHSLIRDPPFSSLDLISCRNVLIYLGADLQRKLVPLFHFALRTGGFLLLGPSESLAAHSELFDTVDKKHRLFRRNGGVVRPPLEFPLAGRSARPKPVPVRPDEPGEPAVTQVFSHAFERMILEDYAPPAAVTNANGDILYLVGRAGRYLQVAAGRPTNNLFDLSQGKLRVELRSALAKTVASRRKVVRSNLAVDLDGATERLRITARPLPGVHPESDLYAIVLQSMGPDAEVEDDEDVLLAPEQPIIEQLEDELRTTRANLQSAMQDLETTNEELKSANEELIATNEELQSANEELQTSKEELQAANDELRTKVLELDAANGDLQYHFAGTHIITIFLDRELRIMRCTPAASKLFNVLDSDLGRPFRDLAPRFVEEDVVGAAATVLRTEAGIERQVHRSDDSTWFLRILPYRSQEHAITSVGITFVDISGLVRAEEAERRYGRLLLLSPDAILVWRLDGGIETWNRGAEELYGFSADEAVAKDARELLREAYPRPWPDIEAELRNRGRWQGEVDAQAKDGRSMTVSAKLALLRGDDGVERVLQTDRDITELKAGHAERERLIEALREADRRKDAFLAMLSHELRNPLAPIHSSLFILDQAAPGGDQARRAKAILERQVAQLTRIVDDLLEITRISRGKLQVQLSRLELGDLVRRTTEDHRPMITTAGLALELRADERPLWVNGDAARLAQVLGNLLGNAAKFTNPGDHVVVSLEEAADRRMAAIRVRDDGVGIAPDLLPHLGVPFMQGDPTLARRQGGLGLGLALAKRLVEQHGGELHVHSDGPDKGAEFTIRLPLAETPSARSGPSARTSSPTLRRILVVEDNVDAAESLCAALQFDEHEVEVAHSGPEGLRKVRQMKPDVVICDIGLPGMDGYEVARAIRADAELRSVQLVALTGYALPEDLVKARAAGFDHHLAKPPSIRGLQEILRHLSG